MTQAEAGKGSRPRPYSVSYTEWINRWDAIFARDIEEDSMDEKKKGTCGCGRSPTGNCIGWHGLTTAEYESKLAEYNMKHLEVTAEEEEAFKDLEKRSI